MLPRTLIICLLADYFHLSAVTISVHGSLITICQPYIRKSKRRPLTTTGSKDVDDSYSPSEFAGYDVLLFGCPLNVITPTDSKEVLALRYRRAQLVHWQLCSIIFTAILSLRRKLNEYVHLLPTLLKVKVQSLDINPTISNLSELAQKCFQRYVHRSMLVKTKLTAIHHSVCSCSEMESAKPANFDFLTYQNISDLPADFRPDDYITTVESDMAYLCGSAIVQWQQFLRVVLHSEKIVQHLAKAHHLQRIKRFSEAFFVVERPRNHLYSVCDSSSGLFNEVSDALRKSQYFALLPRCDVECVALDGDATTLPIIYEEKYEHDLMSAPAAPTAGETTSLADVSLEERLSNVSISKKQSFKRNFKEKLLTRLSFSSPSRLREESPRSAKSGKRSDKRRKSLPSSHENLSTGHELITDAVNLTLLRLKRFEPKSGTQKDGDGGAKSNSRLIHEVASMQDIKSECKRMTTSESLPDLSSGKKHRKRNVSIKPARQFGEATEYKLKVAHESIIERIEEEFEGTAYFPKPPVQFTGAESAKAAANDTSEEETASADTFAASGVGDDKEHEVSEASSSGSSSEGKLVADARSADECTFLEMLKHGNCLVCGERECMCGVEDDDKEASSPQSLLRPSAIGSDLVNFVQAKEMFRQKCGALQKTRGWNFYSDFAKLASRVPYFQCDYDLRAFCPEGLHLIICVHGLDGNSADLRLVKTYLELGLPTSNFEFLMSQRNQGETFEGFEALTDRLVQEITYHISVLRLSPTKIRYIVRFAFCTWLVRTVMFLPLVVIAHTQSRFASHFALVTHWHHIHSWKRKKCVKVACTKDTTLLKRRTACNSLTRREQRVHRAIV